MELDLILLEQELKAMELDNDIINNYISYASNLKNNNVPVIFELEHLRKLLHISREEFYGIYYSIKYQYHTIYIPKSKIKYETNKGITRQSKKYILSKVYNDNEVRHKFKWYNKVITDLTNNKSSYYRKLDLPSKKLKYIQRYILDNILYRVDVHDAAHGFVPGKSTISNARVHVGNEFVAKLDMRDFFPTITAQRVYGLFRSFGYNKSISFTLTKVCTYNGSLPQGAPTSPYISNLICRKLDYRISTLCKKNNLNFSRYADDITISGGRKVKKVLPIIKDIIKNEGFSINDEKTKILHNSHKQKVTGVVVNQKVSIPKSFYRNLRQELYYMNKFGVSSHLLEKQTMFKSNTKAYYFGLVHYCYMIDPIKGEKLLQLLEKINWNS
jgi:retron-type reverse transcriptase